MRANASPVAPFVRATPCPAFLFVRFRKPVRVDVYTAAAPPATHAGTTAVPAVPTAAAAAVRELIFYGWGR